MINKRRLEINGTILAIRALLRAYPFTPSVIDNMAQEDCISIIFSRSRIDEQTGLVIEAKCGVLPMRQYFIIFVPVDFEPKDRWKLIWRSLVFCHLYRLIRSGASAFTSLSDPNVLLTPVIRDETEGRRATAIEGAVRGMCIREVKDAKHRPYHYTDDDIVRLFQLRESI